MPVNIIFYFTDSDSDSEGDDEYDKAPFATILRFASTNRNARPERIYLASAVRTHFFAVLSCVIFADFCTTGEESERQEFFQNFP